MTKRRGLVIAALLLGVAGAGGIYVFLPGGREQTADPNDREAVALGKVVYEEACASCHGARLEGQPDWRIRGADGRLPAPPHDERGHTWHHPDRQLFEMTKYGIEAFAPAGYKSDMPAYEGVLSDAEIWAVLAYIKSRWPDEVRIRHQGINDRAP